MRMLRKQVLMGAAIAAAASVVAGSADAACKQGFCVSGTDDVKSGRHLVQFTTSLRNYTHFNVWNGSEQIELGKNERSFSVIRESARALPFKYVYRIQACNKGGAFSSSSCTPWVTFTHTRTK